MLNTIRRIFNFFNELTSESLKDIKSRVLYPSLDGRNSMAFLMTQTVINFDDFSIESDRDAWNGSNDFQDITIHTRYNLKLENGKFSIIPFSINVLRTHKNGNKDMRCVFEDDKILIGENGKNDFVPFEYYESVSSFLERNRVVVDDKLNFYLIEAYKMHCRERIECSVAIRNYAYHSRFESYYSRYKNYKKI